MRIGIDARLWGESGVGRYTRNLVKNLQVLDKKNEYVLFGLDKNIQEILNQVQNNNFKAVKTDIRWHTIEEQFKFPSIINKENLDLMHFPYFSVPIFYNKPFLVTIHDLILDHFPTGEASTLALPLYKLKLLGYKFVISQAAKKAKKIITVSNATKKEIVDHLGVDGNKIVVTYEGGVENSKFNPRSSRGQNSKLQVKSKNYFLYVGNAYPHKNLERLIDAFNNVILERSDRIPLANDLQLVLVGREDYFYKRLKEKVRKMSLEKSVRFLGEVSDEELSSLYKNALALIMPSLMEGFGLPSLEAMTNKCLVLASDISSLKEICGDAAIYFDPFNTDDIAQKITSVLNFNDSYHYSDNIKKGFERAKMFSWEKMAKETLKIYESCASV